MDGLESDLKLAMKKDKYFDALRFRTRQLWFKMEDRVGTKCGAGIKVSDKNALYVIKINHET